jgi:hypothetical protein
MRNLKNSSFGGTRTRNTDCYQETDTSQISKKDKYRNTDSCQETDKRAKSARKRSIFARPSRVLSKNVQTFAISPPIIECKFAQKFQNSSTNKELSNHTTDNMKFAKLTVICCFIFCSVAVLANERDGSQVEGPQPAGHERHGEMDQDSDNQVIRPCQFPALPS